MPSRRPQIKPWLRPIGRLAGQVQFGILPDGVIVTGVTPAEVELLRRLDGSLSRNGSFAAALAAGVSAARWRALLDLVADLGVLAPEPGAGGGGSGAAAPDRSPTDRAEGGGGKPATEGRDTRLPHVLVEGDGAMAEAIAGLLRSCGTRVTQGRPATDLVIAAPHVDQPSLTVLVGGAAVDPRRGDVWLAHATPALPVLIAGPWASVGPIVEDRQSSPCLWCLELHRSDRDREWPLLMAQLHPVDPPIVRAPEPEPDPDPALAQLVAGTVALLAERVLGGDRPPPGVSVEVSLPWPRMDHRRWTRHPRCLRHALDRPDVA